MAIQENGQFEKRKFEIGESFKASCDNAGYFKSMGLDACCSAFLPFDSSEVSFTCCRFCRMLHLLIWCPKRVDQRLGCRDGIQAIMMPIINCKIHHIFIGIANFVLTWPRRVGENYIFIDIPILNEKHNIAVRQSFSYHYRSQIENLIMWHWYINFLSPNVMWFWRNCGRLEWFIWDN